MDYKRVYAEFIKDRRERAVPPGSYSEVHHIIPRCMGGGDAKSNLIRLSPEDHYFAHLLLAKAYGGKLISALWRMLQCSENTLPRKTAARRSYGLAKRLIAKFLAERWKARGNPLFNTRQHEWANYRTGQTETATLYDMHLAYGGSRAQWTNVLRGTHPSIFGWMPSNRITSHARSEKGQSFSFVNRDGRTFQGTQSEFVEIAGISVAGASRVVRHRSVTECGWRLVGVHDRKANTPKNGRRASRLGTGRTYKLRHRDGRLFEGNAEDFRLLLERPEGFSMSVRLSGLRRGAAPSLYGWVLAEKEKDSGREEYRLV